jgi:hypothetical protein
MTDNVFEETTYRANCGTMDDYATILTNCVNRGASYGVAYIEIYETDVRHLKDVIAYAHDLLDPVPPVITRQPVSRQVALGQSAHFFVGATGDTLVYQWSNNGEDIAGATSSNYITPPATREDNGSVFSVVVSNRSGTVTSDGARLRVRRGATR